MGQSLQTSGRPSWNTRRITLGVLVLVAAIVAVAIFATHRIKLRRAEAHIERLLRAGENAQALKAAESLPANSSASAYFRARALFALGRDHECDQALDLALVRGHDALLIDRLRGFLRLREKRYAEAEPLLVGVMSRRAEVADPELDEALARIFLQTYKMDLASRVLAKWRLDAPGDARPYLWQTEVDQRTGAEPKRIAEHYREALKRDPSMLDARSGLADVLSELKQHAEAEHEYRAYLSEKPEDFVVLIRAAHNDVERGDDASALRRLNQALRLKPRSGAALRERAKIDLRADRLKEALDALDTAVESEPYEVDGRYLRSLVFDRLGRTEEAKAERIVVNILRDEEARLGKLRETVNRNPRDGNARLEIARWMFDHGQGTEGVRWVETILATDPSNRAAHGLLAKHFQKQGEPALANFHRLQADLDARGRQP